MAKTIGPLLSASASGSILKRLTYSHRKKVKQARYQRAQKDYLSAARVKPRERFSASIEWWHQLTPEEQAGFAGYDEKAV